MILMDAIILCGGFATRLEPISLFVPKPLLPINGRPLLDHILDSTKSVDIDRYIISTNSKFADQFEYWMKNKMDSGFKGRIEIIVEPTTHNGHKFGAVKGINYAINKAGVSEDVLVIAGDNYCDFDLKKMHAYFAEHRRPAVALYDIGSKENAKRFGVVKIEGNRVVEFEEKPESPKSTLISTCIFMLPKTYLGRIDEYLRENNPDSPGYLFQWLVKEHEMNGVVYLGDWADIGTIDSYKEYFTRNKQ